MTLTASIDGWVREIASELGMIADAIRELGYAVASLGPVDDDRVELVPTDPSGNPSDP